MIATTLLMLLISWPWTPVPKCGVHSECVIIQGAPIVSVASGVQPGTNQDIGAVYRASLPNPNPNPNPNDGRIDLSTVTHWKKVSPRDWSCDHTSGHTVRLPALNKLDKGYEVLLFQYK